MLKSENITLKEPSQQDYESLRKVKPCGEFYLMVGNDPEESIFSNIEKLEKSFQESLSRENYWYVYKDTDLIGVAFLHSIDLDDKRARYAVAIYNSENWSKGYGAEITHCVLKHAFHSLKLHKVDLKVLEYNKRAIASYKKCGFVKEGILRENAFINNVWYNDVIMGILCHEFQSS